MGQPSVLSRKHSLLGTASLSSRALLYYGAATPVCPPCSVPPLSLPVCPPVLCPPSYSPALSPATPSPKLASRRSRDEVAGHIFREGLYVLGTCAWTALKKAAPLARALRLYVGDERVGAERVPLCLSSLAGGCGVHAVVSGRPLCGLQRGGVLQVGRAVQAQDVCHVSHDAADVVML